MALRHEGWEVRTAADAASAVRTARDSARTPSSWT
jgi:hypothetical protein